MTIGKKNKKIEELFYGGFQRFFLEVLDSNQGRGFSLFFTQGLFPVFHIV
jgi:hypothetical protein